MSSWIALKTSLRGVLQDFVKPSGGIGGRPVEVAEMSIKQALRVAARESKAVRRSLVDKLEDMQVIQNPTTSNSGLPEYRLAKAEQLKAQALEKNIASARELMSMFPRLGESANGDRCHAC